MKKLIIYTHKSDVALYEATVPSSLILTYTGTQYTDYHGPVMEIYESSAGRYYKYRGKYWRAINSMREAV